MINTTIRAEDKARLAHDCVLVAGISYWGSIDFNYADDQVDIDYDTIPETYTIIDRDDEGYNDVAPLEITPLDLFDKLYDYALDLMDRYRETGNINQYFVRWAKDMIAYDLDEAAMDMDAAIADCAIQHAMFGKQVYA